MTARHPRRPLWVRILLLGLCAGLVLVFVGLGNWQMRRLDWKLDLIEAVETRAFGDPVAVPRDFRSADHSYLRVRVQGRPVGVQVLVKAVTDLGPGYWVMRPMETPSGILWVNRGFVPPGAKTGGNWTGMPDRIEGLVRPTEPRGTLLERNDPAVDRWVSRDTRAMSAAFGLGQTQPFFIDADHLGNPEAWPRGGLTLLKFRNTHLSYALTWYAMAVLLLGAVAVVAWRRETD